MKKRIVSILWIITIFFSGCEDIFVEDISDKTVQVIAPNEGYTSNNPVVRFSWEKMEDAEKYHIQIVTGTFEDADEMIADKEVTENFYEHVLFPGSFQWRIRALNDASATAFTTLSFTIGADPSLSEMEVSLLFPGEESALKEAKVTFKWQKIDIATNYRFEIKEDTWTGNDYAEPKLLTTDSLVLELEEGKFVWGVQALNNSSLSRFGTNTVYIDLTEPVQPHLLAPENNASSSNFSVTFSWIREEDDGSPVKDSLFIADSENFGASDIVLARECPTASYTFQFTTTDEYFWRVKSFDKAGNESSYSETRKITITN